MSSAPTPTVTPDQSFRNIFRHNAGISLDDLASAHPRVNALRLRVERLAPDLSEDVLQNITKEIMTLSGMKPGDKPHNEYRLALLQYAANDPRWHIGDQGKVLSANRDHQFEMDIIPYKDGYAFAASRDGNPLELVHALDIGDAAKGVHSIHLHQRLEIRPHVTAPKATLAADLEIEPDPMELAEDFEPPSP